MAFKNRHGVFVTKTIKQVFEQNPVEFGKPGPAPKPFLCPALKDAGETIEETLERWGKKYGDKAYFKSPEALCTIGTRWSQNDPYKSIMENRKMEKPTTLQIKEVENGFTVEAGCKIFVFENLKSLTAALTLFYTDYEKAYKKYVKEAE